jgi:drug/metabolite transporter (DMT)-like permease
VGVLLALASSLLWGTGDFLAGELSRRRAALAVAGAAQFVGLVFMLGVVLATGGWADGPALRDYAGWAALASITGLGGLVAFYTALAAGRMGVVSPIAALGVLVPLAAGLLTGEQPSGVQTLGILFAVVGVVLASGPEVSGGVGLRPVLLAGLAALLFGLFFVFLAKGAEADAVLTTTVQRACSTLLVLAIALVLRSAGGLRRRDTGRLVAVGLFDVGANLTFGLASTMGLLAVVAVLGSLYPVVTVLLAWWVLKERLLPAQYVGVAAALVGVACIAGG